MKRFLSLDREAYYPRLRRDGYRITSEYDEGYNCIAHAAGTKAVKWWPVEMTGVHWPPGAPLEETIEAFVAAYATQNYARCTRGDRTHEPGIEKIALYVDANREPTHAAVQLENGYWSSKLGDWEDIEHQTLEALEDDAQARGLGYGLVAAILRRTRPAPGSSS